MRKVIDTNTNTTDNINLYITSQIFHDPVRANDGYIYEREDIKRYISKFRTSPFTEQPMEITDLESDDHLQFLPEQHDIEEPSRESEKTDGETVRIPTATQTDDNSTDEKQSPSKSEKAMSYTADAITQAYDDPTDGKQSPMKNIKMALIIIICLLISVIIIILILAIPFQFYPAAMNVTSTYSGIITADSPVYFVHRNDRFKSEKMMYRYKKIGVIISTSGLYRFECKTNNFPNFAYIGAIDLYKKSFDATNLSMNQLTYKYADKGIHKAVFGVSLRSKYYILVASITNVYENSFSILVTGPAKIAFLE